MLRTAKFVSVCAENGEVCVSLCGERQSLCQFMRRTSKFVSVYAENDKVRVSVCGERQSSRQFA